MEKVIIRHKNSLGDTSFDVVVRLGNVRKYRRQLAEHLYKVPCKHVKAFLEKHKNFRYIGSQDFSHIPIINREIAEFMMDLIEDEFEVIDASLI